MNSLTLTPKIEAAAIIIIAPYLRLIRFDGNTGMWHSNGMTTQTIPVDACSKLIESATRSCQPLITAAQEPVNSTADSLAALSTAFTFGSILLGIIALFGAITWGFFVKGWAEKQAREEAERCTKKWIEEEGFPMLRREMQEWKKTFPPEVAISDVDISELVAAAGADGKEDGDGKK